MRDAHSEPEFYCGSQVVRCVPSLAREHCDMPCELAFRRPLASLLPAPLPRLDRPHSLVLA